MSPTSPQIARLPKSEIHLHLEGCIQIDLLRMLSDAQGSSPPRSFDTLFQVRSLDEFLKTLDWMCGLFQTSDQVLRLARSFAEYAQAQNMVYVELIVNPSHWHALDLDTLFGSLNDAFDNLLKSKQVDVRLIPSLGRHQSASAAEHLVDWMLGSGLPRICGLSIDGSEAVNGSNNERFASAFRQVRDGGFGTTAHAGESSGAQGVLGALDILGADRIDHGVRAIESPELLARLCRDQVPLNVCVSSNCALLYEELAQHPLAQLLETGINVTLNTDDPVVLSTTLCDELDWLSRSYGWTMQDLVQFQSNTIDAAFCSASDKQKLKAKLRQVADLTRRES